MEKTPEQTVQDQVDAYNARDLVAFLATYDEEAELAHHPDGKIVAAGRERMSAVYGPLFEKNPDLHCTIRNRIVHGNFVIDHEEVAGLSAEGTVHAVAVYEVRESLIQRVWFLRD
jgi:hypothetical protein